MPTNKQQSFEDRYKKVAGLSEALMALRELEAAKREVVSRLKKAITPLLSKQNAIIAERIQKVFIKVFINEIFTKVTTSENATEIAELPNTLGNLWEGSVLQWENEDNEDKAKGRPGISDEEWKHIRSEEIIKIITDAVFSVFKQEQENILSLNKNAELMKQRKDEYSKFLPIDKPSQTADFIKQMIKASFDFKQLPDCVTQSSLQSIFLTQPSIGLSLLDNPKFMPRLVHGSLTASRVHMQDMEGIDPKNDVNYTLAEMKWFCFYKEFTSKLSGGHGEYITGREDLLMFNTAFADYINGTEFFSTKRKLVTAIKKFASLCHRLDQSNREDDKAKASAGYEILSQKLADNQTIHSLCVAQMYGYSNDDMLARLSQGLELLNKVFADHSPQMKRLKSNSDKSKNSSGHTFSIFSKEENLIQLLEDVRDAMTEAYALSQKASPTIKC